MKILDRQVSCECNFEGCSCGDTTDMLFGNIPICGCCAADCPDVHPDHPSNEGFVGPAHQGA